MGLLQVHLKTGGGGYTQILPLTTTLSKVCIGVNK